MVLTDLLYTSMLTPGILIVDEFTHDGKPVSVRTIAAVDEISQGYYSIRFGDGGVTHSLGDERWKRA